MLASVGSVGHKNVACKKPYNFIGEQLLYFMLPREHRGYRDLFYAFTEEVCGVILIYQNDTTSHE